MFHNYRLYGKKNYTNQIYTNQQKCSFHSDIGFGIEVGQRHRSFSVVILKSKNLEILTLRKEFEHFYLKYSVEKNKHLFSFFPKSIVIPGKLSVRPIDTIANVAFKCCVTSTTLTKIQHGNKFPPSHQQHQFLPLYRRDLDSPEKVIMQRSYSQ